MTTSIRQQNPTITIRDIINSDSATTSENGQKVYEAIAPLLHQGTVTVDMAGIKVFQSAFFNFAFGQLLGDFYPKDVDDRLFFMNMPSYAAKVYGICMQNAETFYYNDSSHFSGNRSKNQEAIARKNLETEYWFNLQGVKYDCASGALCVGAMKRVYIMFMRQHQVEPEVFLGFQEAAAEGAIAQIHMFEVFDELKRGELFHVSVNEPYIVLKFKVFDDE
jgi:hypothetical protein